MVGVPRGVCGGGGGGEGGNLYVLYTMCVFEKVPILKDMSSYKIHQ